MRYRRILQPVSGRNPKFISLRRKISYISLLTLLILLPLCFLIERQMVGEAQRRLAKNELVSKAHVIASLINETRQSSPGTLQRVLQGLGADPRLLSAQVVEEHNNTIGSYLTAKSRESLDPDLLKSALDEAILRLKSTVILSHFKEHSSLSVIIPLPAASNGLDVLPGAMRLEYDFDPTLSAARRATLVETGFDAVMFTLALLVLNALLFRFVERPVRSLTKTARAIADGDLATRVPAGIGTEIGQLATAFNRMADGLCQKIEEIRHSEERIQRQTGTLESVLNGMSAGVIVANPDGMILLMNHFAQTIARNDSIGKPLDYWSSLYDVYQSDGITHMPINEYPLWQAVRGRQVDNVEGLFKAKDGSKEFWLLGSARPIFRSDGGIWGGVIVFSDISERKMAQVNEAKLAAIVRYSKDAIFTVDPDRKITSWNATAEEIYGYSRQEIIGREVSELFPKESIPSHLVPYDRCRQGDAVTNLHAERVKKDGKRVILSLTISPIRDVGGKIIQLCTIARDITEIVAARNALRELADDLRRSNEDLQAFAYIASHDLNEPLRMITTYLHLLERRYAEKLGPDAKDFIQFAVDGSTRLKLLIDDLLKYSRVGNASLDLKTIDANAVVDIVRQNLKFQIQEASAEIVVDWLPEVCVDPIQFCQLLQNLITNAIKFRGENPPRIRISAAMEGDVWRFSVADNGIGIAPSQKDRIFGMFQRLHGRDTYPGTGIGLAVCKKIVERHGGRIWVQSTSGLGSEFFFTIPSRPIADLEIPAERDKHASQDPAA